MRLTRPIAVQRLLMSASIALPEERGDLLAILLVARDRVTIAAPDLEPLLGLSPVAPRILEHCGRLSLLRAVGDSWAITDTGRHALVRGEVLVPRRDLWEVWYTEDAAVPTNRRLLRVQPAGRRITGQPRRPIVDLPAAVLELADGRELLTRDGPVRLDDLGGRKGEPLGAIDARMVWKFEGGSGLSWVEIEGTGDEPWRLELAGPVTSHAQAWTAFLDARGVRHDWTGSALRIGFDALLDDTARLSRLQPLSASCRLRAANDWVDFVAGPVDVPVTPRTEDDARRWATWYMTHEITDFIPRQRYDELRERASALFPEHVVQVPDRAELARTLDPPGSWFLLAPEDWLL